MDFFSFYCDWNLFTFLLHNECMCACMHVCVHLCVCVCVSVCVKEREGSTTVHMGRSGDNVGELFLSFPPCAFQGSNSGCPVHSAS